MKENAFKHSYTDDDEKKHNKRVALKKFMKESKHLRFREKMRNVRQWKNE